MFLEVSYVCKLCKSVEAVIDKKLKRVDLKTIAGISSTTLAKLGKDEYVSMESIEKICDGLECDISDVMCFSRKETREWSNENVFND